MNKIIFCMLCMVGAVAIVSAQENEKLLKVETVTPDQDLCSAVPASHWSIGIKGGVSDYLFPPDAPKTSDRYNLTYGGMLEYTFNPLIGIGLEYDYNDYSRPYTYRNFEGKLDGLTQDAILFGSVNLSNALLPFRAGFWKCLNIYGDVGAGVAFYNYSLDNLRVKYEEGMMGKLGLNFEFTLSKSFNLSIAGQYNQYDSRNMSSSRANRNCDALIGTIGLRYKIGGVKSTHVRNINMCEYSPEPAPIIVTKTYLKGDTDELLNRVNAAEKENATIKQKIKDIKEDAK